MTCAGATLHAMSAQTTRLTTLHRPDSSPQAGLGLPSVGQERLIRVPLTYLARTGCYDTHGVSGLHEIASTMELRRTTYGVPPWTAAVQDKAGMTYGVWVPRIGCAFSAGLDTNTVDVRSCGSSRGQTILPTASAMVWTEFEHSRREAAAISSAAI